MNENPGHIPHCKSCTCAIDYMRSEIEWRDGLIKELRRDLHAVRHERDIIVKSVNDELIPALLDRD